MPPPTSPEEFLDFALKSGVAEAAKLQAYAAKFSPLPATPALAAQMVRDGLLSGFQAEQLLQGKWRRFFIGKYKVLERLGRGGMANVFLCEHKLMRRRVALKVLPAAKSDDPASLERFYREARAVAAVDHPNLVRAYDIDQDENLHFIVMEYVDGTNLYDLVKKGGPLDPVRAAHYMAGAAVGLEHAHHMGLVHRDIKPGNILIDRTGVVKILDLGLALFFQDESDQLTKKYDENILGTADYLAPEQALDSHSVDIRADIYSLGGTFYFLLTGQPPFPDGNVAQKLMQHQHREPTALTTLRPEVPAELAAVVSKMMAKDPDRRYQTPAEVAAALGPWVQSPIAPPRESELPQLSLAAMGTGGALTARTVAGGATLVEALPVPLPPQAAATPAPASPTATQSSKSRLAAPPPPAPVVPAEEESPFGGFAEFASAGPRSGRASRASSSKTRLAAAAPALVLQELSPGRVPRAWAAIIAAAVVLSVLVSGAGGYGIYRYVAGSPVPTGKR